MLSVKKFFEDLNNNTMHLVDEFYDTDAQFIDPVVHFHNREQIKKYYANLYKNVTMIRFDMGDETNQNEQTMVVWKMTVQAKNFNGGKPVIVDGISHIKRGGKEGKVIYHRDYFDMGDFVYEWLPVIGPLVRFVKNKFKQIHHQG